MRCAGWLLCLGLLVPLPALSVPWVFDAPLGIGGVDGGAYFHRLGGAGRRHVAADREGVVVVWEDDRDASSQVYLALKRHPDSGFGPVLRVSDGEEAFEPAVLALGANRWLVAWEQDQRIVARVVFGMTPGPVAWLSGEGARQVTLVGRADGRLVAVWARDHPRGQSLEVIDLRVHGDSLVVGAAPLRLAPAGESDYQAHPAAAFASTGALLVAWEDRRAGHTRILYSLQDSAGDWAPPAQLNEHNAPTGAQGEALPLGSGAMRVSIAADDRGGLRALWLDKRNAASGYAVWGALSHDAGTSFSRNHAVQDEFGATVPQWHASLTGGPHGFVAVWDDAREGWGDSEESGDVILSWSDDEDWSADLLVPGASGSGYQGSPAVALDPTGDLHLIWLARDDLQSPTRLHYLRGRREAGR